MSLNLAPLVVCLAFLAPLARGQRVHSSELAVRVAVQDGVATTRLALELVNEGATAAEATWVLPLGEGAVADGLTLTADGVEMSGDVLDADQARGVYARIVRARRDPALLEYMGRGCLRARVFPIPPHGSVRLEVTFRQILPTRGGLVRWSFPLRAAAVGGLPPEVTLDLMLESTPSLRNVFSPARAIQVLQPDDHRARATFEGSPSLLPGEELVVFYGLEEEEFGLHLLSHHAAEELEGTGLFLISPRREWESERVLAKSVVLVLDTSGSMQGAKLEQAKAAATYFVQSLRTGDRFDVVPFATEPRPFFGKVTAVTPETQAAALARIARLEAVGGTDIDGSLAAGLGALDPADERLPILVFLTDGEPTVGEQNEDQLVANAQARAGERTRVFVFGIGQRVNTLLLDNLASRCRGARDYVRANESIEEKTGALFRKISHPVMSDLVLEVEGLRLARQVPARLPDLFAGERLEVMARYSGSGPHRVRLSGVVDGARRSYDFEADFAAPGDERNDFAPVLWAERRVGFLLDLLRRQGPSPELLDEVQALGKRYRIVTPYTSHLVLEEGLGFPTPAPPTAPGSPASSAGPRSPGAAPASGGGGSDGWFLGKGQRRVSAEAQIQRLAERLQAAGVLPGKATPEELLELARAVVQELSSVSHERSGVGQAAVEKSEYLRRLMGGGSLPRASLLDLFSQRVRGKVFQLRQGVWTDRELEGAAPVESTRIEAFSPGYFELLDEHPGLAPYLAFSSRLRVAWEGAVYEIVAAP